jgi:hypothetical protein
MQIRGNKRWEPILPFPIFENSEIASIHAAPHVLTPLKPVTVDKIRRGGSDFAGLLELSRAP